MVRLIPYDEDNDTAPSPGAASEWSTCKSCNDTFHDSLIWKNGGKCPACGATNWGYC